MTEQPIHRAWRESTGGGSNVDFMAWADRMGRAYCRERGIPRVMDRDDYVAWVERKMADCP